MNFGGDLVSFPLSNFPSHHFRLRFCIIHIMSDRAVPLLRADAKSCHLMSYCVDMNPPKYVKPHPEKGGFMGGTSLFRLQRLPANRVSGQGTSFVRDWIEVREPKFDS